MGDGRSSNTASPNERLVFDSDEALTLGKAVAGLNAQAKGRRLGIFKPGIEKGEKARERRRGEEFFIEVCGRTVPATNTAEGVRATIKGTPIHPESVERYLEGKFGDRLSDVRKAMESLAKRFTPRELADEAYPLYVKFRPSVPEGVKGWGAPGTLDLSLIRSLRS